MDVTKYKLGSNKAKSVHNDIINSGSSFSLTVTLNPFWNSLPVNEQYNKCIIELVRCFKELGPYYKIAMATCEFTKEYNVHFHCYLVLTDETEMFTFEQNWKRVRMSCKYLGKMYKLKQVDEVTDVLKGYPFKDIERTIKYSNTQNCLFTPHHYVFKSNGNVLRCENSQGVSIKKAFKKMLIS